MSAQRFVNLNRSATYIQDPSGQTISVRPFREVLDANTRKPDGVYVVEGEFWRRYVSGTAAGPLHAMPPAKAFGRDSFPDVPVRGEDGLARAGASDASPAVAVQAGLGRFRGAGDVLTPEGKIRRRNPITGLDEEVDDIPANRTVLQSVNPPGQGERQLRRSIVDYLEELGITTELEFNSLPDEQLLKIPGMHPHALPHLRANIRKLLAESDAAAARAEGGGAALDTLSNRGADAADSDDESEDVEDVDEDADDEIDDEADDDLDDDEEDDEEDDEDEEDADEAEQPVKKAAPRKIVTKPLRKLPTKPLKKKSRRRS